jgi:hypothetical protein
MLHKIITHLQNGENFSFSRFGDGEWSCLLGKNGANCDGHAYFHDMGDRLLKIVESNPKYYMGLQTLAESTYPDEIAKYPIEWVESDCLHRASIRGEIQPFFDELNKKNIIFVGNHRHQKQNIINVDTFIEVPLNDCWRKYENTLSSLKSIVDKDDVIIYCASMMANVLIDDIYNEFGDTVTQIDCGSLFEPYMGISIRSYHSKLIQKLKQK